MAGARTGGRPGRAMPDQLFTFLWRVPVSGFRWRDLSLASDPGKRGRFLTDLVPLGQLQDFDYYAPLQDPETSGLFRRFAELEPSEDAIRGFADRYGPLGLGELVALESGLGLGEPASLWLEEIEAMREAVALWAAARSGDLAYLQTRLFWDEGGRQVRYELRTESGKPKRVSVVALDTGRPDWLGGRFDLVAPGDLAGPALLYVQAQVNERLAEHTRCRLLVGQQASRRKGPARFGVHAVPGNLLGAMWLQFGQAIAGRKSYRRCTREGCGVWYEVNPKTTRADRQYCSAACRAKAWREKNPPTRKRRDGRGKKAKS